MAELSLKFYPDKPFEHDPKDLDKWDKKEDYICQQKVDGWRMIIFITDEGPELLSRLGHCWFGCHACLCHNFV